MFHLLRSAKRLLGSLFTSRRPETIRHRPGRVRPRLETLEDRLAPATVSDGGTGVLSIALGANENLAIVSNGTSYTFSSNQDFTAAAAADPANQSTAFTGIGTNTLTLTGSGMAQYGTGINITDTEANATVTFNDSGVKGYGNSFTVTLSDPAAGAVSFNGMSSFGIYNLQATSTMGIDVNSGATLTSSSGNLTLVANPLASPNGQGVVLDGTVANIGSGTISVAGHGNSSGGIGNGVYLDPGGKIAGGSGSVSVTGTGGASPGVGASGVLLGGNGFGSVAPIITSTGGDVQVIGQAGDAGAAGGAAGVEPQYAQISAGGMGNVTVNGSGLATSSGHSGVVVDSFGLITSSGGNVEVDGQGGGVDSYPFHDFISGVVIDGQVTAGGNGTVTVRGAGDNSPRVGFANGARADGVLVDLGDISSNGGNVLVIGQGGGSGVNNYGVEVSGGAITAGGTGTVTVQGTGGAGPGEVNSGVSIASGTIIIPGGDTEGSITLSGRVTTNAGDILIIGQGGRGTGSSHSDSIGVAINDLSQIAAGGTGNVTVEGTSDSTTIGSSIGVLVVGFGTTISSNGGDVRITGVGGRNEGYASGGDGVLVNGTITSANIRITGTAGPNNSAAAIDLSGNITTPRDNNNNATTGTITLIGDSMNLEAGQVDGGAGTVVLMPKTPGTRIDLGGADAPGALGLSKQEIALINATNVLIGNAASGTITISDAVSFSPVPRPPFLGINPFLQPSNVTLTSAGDIVFNNGSITTIAVNLNLWGFPVETGGTVTLVPGSAGAVRLIPNGVVIDVVAAAELLFAPGSNLAIAISGTAVNQYSQLNVFGSVNLTGVNLLVSGALHPALGQTFTIVRSGPKYGNPPVFGGFEGFTFGEFNGLPEGARIHNFLGSGLDAVITYHGGFFPYSTYHGGFAVAGNGGDDVVLTVVQGVPALPRVTVNSLSSLEGKSGLTPFVFQIRLTAPAAKAVTYDVYTTDGTAKAGVNYISITAGDSAHGGTVTFAQGSAFATVTVYVIAGSLPVTPATIRAFFTVNLSDPSAPDVPLASGTGTIVAQVGIPPGGRPAAATEKFSSAHLSRLVAGLLPRRSFANLAEDQPVAPTIGQQVEQQP